MIGLLELLTVRLCVTLGEGCCCEEIVCEVPIGKVAAEELQTTRGGLRLTMRGGLTFADGLTETHRLRGDRGLCMPTTEANGAPAPLGSTMDPREYSSPPEARRGECAPLREVFVALPPAEAVGCCGPV